MRVFLFGSVGTLGGALSETWDTLRLWMRHGLDVRLIHQGELGAHWPARLRELQCPVWYSGQPLDSIPDLPGSIVVGVCSQHFLRAAPALRRLGCRLVWANCMTWLFAEEGRHYERHGLFDAYMFQGEFQRARLTAGLKCFGFEARHGHVIRGAFDIAQWPLEYQPRQPETDFVVGRLARPDRSKWSRRTWEIYGRIDHPRRRAVVMGVDDAIRKWLGPAPPWAEVLPPCALPAREYYRRLHCLMPVNYSAVESWPRIGLEAMACGVPIIAPRSGGWCEMIEHGENGFLASNAQECADLAALLARDEPLRQRIALKARRRLESELANPDLTWAGWQRLFAGLEHAQA
jgi:glycosyltransferase involved in cell wall biosynthesis